MESLKPLFDKLPKNYFDTISEYLDGYSSDDRVLHHDIMERYINEEEVYQEDLKWLKDYYKDDNGIKEEYYRLSIVLWMDAIRDMDEAY